MEDMESKLGAILGDPVKMAQVMELAQSLGLQGGEGPQQAPSPQQSQPPQNQPPQNQSRQSEPGLNLDPGMLRRLSGLAGNARIDPNQQSLLKALRPYIGSQRISRLERAMRAAKMAGLATAFLGSGR